MNLSAMIADARWTGTIHGPKYDSPLNWKRESQLEKHDLGRFFRRARAEAEGHGYVRVNLEE